jgi:hypothetical protein
MATIVDLCVGSVPALMLLAGWSVVVLGIPEAGFGVVLYYGTPLLLFTGTGILWAYWMWRAHRGAMPVRSVGLVVSGLAYTDGDLVCAPLRPLTLRSLALRIGATAMATMNVLVVAFALFQLAFVLWGQIAG